MSQLRKNLVVLRAGDGSLHRQWLAGNRRDFDLFISYYGKIEGKHQGDGEYWEHRPGPKWSCIAELLEAHAALLDRYDGFWFPDDDLAADTDTLNRMFALFHGVDLKLAQPALTDDSYYSWEQLLVKPQYVLRKVAFVEVMAPLFSQKSLKQCIPTFRSSRSGWGLDWVWAKVLGGGSDGRIAVLDATPVKHTRPIGGGDLYKSNPELDPNNDSRRLTTEYGLSEQRFTDKFVAFGAIGNMQLPWGQRMAMWIRRMNAARLGRRRLAQGR